jgi:type II secretory pathway component PulF
MSDFYYEARDEAGLPISGRIRAMDVKDAIRQLEANQWDVISVRTVPKPNPPAEIPRQEPPAALPAEATSRESFGGELPPMSRKDSTELAGHLADVMNAGLPLAPGLSALAKELPDGKVRRGLKVMVSQLESGRSLEAVLDSRQVPPDLRALVRAGLRSGHTGEVLSQYVRHTQLLLDLRRRMALAWGYPLVLILTSMAILFVFLWFLVPGFTEIFEGFGTELPAMTQSIIWLSKTLHNDWPLMLGTVLVAWFVIRMYWRYGLSAAQRRRFLWCLPIVGHMIRSAALARFSRLLGLLLDNNVPLPDALRLAGQGAADAELGEAAMYLADVVESGRPLTGNEFACQRFPATFVQLLSQIEGQKPMAQAIHALSDACTSSARMFESQARVAAARTAAFCQPLIVIFTACTVGYMVLSLFLPLVKLLNDLS